jgi:hypothetical protein
MVSVDGRPFLSVTSYARLLGWVAERRLHAPALVDLLVADHGRAPAVSRELSALGRQAPPETVRRILDDGTARLRPDSGGRRGTRPQGPRPAGPGGAARIRGGRDVAWRPPGPPGSAWGPAARRRAG